MNCTMIYCQFNHHLWLLMLLWITVVVYVFQGNCFFSPCNGCPFYWAPGDATI